MMRALQTQLALGREPWTPPPLGLAEDLKSFSQFNQATRQIVTLAKSFAGKTHSLPTFVNEFWTARQRARVVELL